MHTPNLGHHSGVRGHALESVLETFGVQIDHVNASSGERSGVKLIGASPNRPGVSAAEHNAHLEEQNKIDQVPSGPCEALSRKNRDGSLEKGILRMLDA